MFDFIVWPITCISNPLGTLIDPQAVCLVNYIFPVINWVFDLVSKLTDHCLNMNRKIWQNIRFNERKFDYESIFDMKFILFGLLSFQHF